MEFLLVILIILIISIVVFTFKLINIVKGNDYRKTINFLKRYSMFLFSGLALFYIVMIIVSMLNLDNFGFVFILVVKMVITAVYFVDIFISNRKLLNNLSNNVIFESSNADYILRIGTDFIYLAITEIAAGLILGVINFIAGVEWKDFQLSFNVSIALFLIIGIILLIITHIFKKAIEIYQENKLTI